MIPSPEGMFTGNGFWYVTEAWFRMRILDKAPLWEVYLQKCPKKETLNLSAKKTKTDGLCKFVTEIKYK